MSERTAKKQRKLVKLIRRNLTKEQVQLFAKLDIDFQIEKTITRLWESADKKTLKLLNDKIKYIEYVNLCGNIHPIEFDDKFDFSF